MLEPSGLIGCSRPPNMYWTSVVHDLLVSWPTLSVTLTLVVLSPTVLVSIACVPDGSDTRPDSPSLAVMVAWTPAAFSNTPAGQSTERPGGAARPPGGSRAPVGPFPPA